MTTQDLQVPDLVILGKSEWNGIRVFKLTTGLCRQQRWLRHEGRGGGTRRPMRDYMLLAVQHGHGLFCRWNLGTVVVGVWSFYLLNAGLVGRYLVLETTVNCT